MPSSTGHLLADLAVGQQPIGGFVGVVVHPVQLDLAGVLEVALDHLEAHELRVLDHFLVDGAIALEVLDVIGRAGVRARCRGETRPLPGHFGLGAGAQLQPGALGEAGVQPLHQASGVGRQRGAGVGQDVVGLVESAEDAGGLVVPGQHREGVEVGDGAVFGRSDSAAEQHALAGGLQVGDGGPVLHHPAFGQPRELVGGHDLADGARGDGHGLEVDELNAVLFDRRERGVESSWCGVGLAVLVERCGIHGRAFRVRGRG